MGKTCCGDATVRVIASPKTWIEGNAVRQLEQTAKLKGIQWAVGFPDLHAGKGCPIGAAFLSKDWIYPFLVGNDIGCGMAFWRSDIKVTKAKLERWENKLNLDGAWDGSSAQWLEDHHLSGNLFPRALGTIGGGNHFAELQAVDRILDPSACANLGLDKRVLYLLVHSGSRGLGQNILERHIEKFAAKGILDCTSDGLDYMAAHREAVQWAQVNRALIAHRFFRAIRSEGRCLFDHTHNAVTRQNHHGQDLWLHRKGASPGDQGPLVIPGSRGSHSYLVEPIGDQADNAYSLAHGAGRKWNRKEVKGRLVTKYKPDDLRKTVLGSRVICEDKALIYEEAPEAYKNIDQVIQDLVDFGLVRVLAILRPVLSYKTRRKR